MWIWETTKDFIATLPWSPKWACERLKRSIRKKIVKLQKRLEKINEKEAKKNVDK